MILQTAKYVSLVAIIFFWVVQAEWSQYIQRHNAFNKPYMLTWINHSTLSVYFIFACCYVKYHGVQLNGGKEKIYSISEYLNNFGFTVKKYIYQGIFFGLLYLVPNALYFYALGYGSSVGIATTIFNTNIAAAYVFSVLLLNEAVTMKKSLGVLLCIVGTFLVSVLAKPDQPIQFDGMDLVTFSAALLFGLWEVLYKKFAVGGDSPTILLLFIYGSYGLAHLFLFWIFMWPLNAFKIEIFQLPSLDQFKLIFLNMFLATSFNCSFFTALALIDSPVLVSIACLLTIPATTLVDYILFQQLLSTFEIIGGIMIIIGFLLFSVAITNDDDQEGVDDIKNQIYEEETGRNTDNLMNNNSNLNYRKL
jgi:drug/metabolite transporter (DMT)-like permease